MTQPAPFADRVRAAFRPSASGVVGLVDELLKLAREHPLGIGYASTGCSIIRTDSKIDHVTIPLPRSVFRGVLARFAAMCNERVPGSVTPYRGNAKLSDPTSPTDFFQIGFVNTPELLVICLRNTRLKTALPSRGR